VVIALVAFAAGCDDEDGDGGMQQPPPVTPPVEPLGAVGLELIAEGFTSPVLLVEAPDAMGRLYIVDQTGIIYVHTAGGQGTGDVFLDLRDRVRTLMPDYDERGLLGLAFHPDYALNGRFYVFYSTWKSETAPVEWDHTNNISEFTANAGVADPDSERILLQVDHPQFNHNGGTLEFGPDGYLYISIGDGGEANDVGVGHLPGGNAQSLETLLGKILRIDVNGAEPYAVPADNPFATGEGRDEIYAYGFRNPYRFSFDREGDRQLFVGDAGQNRWEEVSIVERGMNYGWNIREGSHCFDPNNADVEPETCPDVGARGEPLVPPIVEYQNAAQPGGVGLVVIGGYVYRGTAIPDLAGDYVFGDFGASFEVASGLLFAARRQDDGTWQMRNLEIANGALTEYVRGFGQDASGEIYLLTAGTVAPAGSTGRVYRIVSKDAVPQPPADDVAQQIASGMTLFTQNCARCHGDDGSGTTIAPPLVGEGALPLDPPPERMVRTTQFVTALDVYEFARQYMPADMPGSLSDQTYIDIVAFALHANGIILDVPLTPDNAEGIVINQQE
jgi:glucose/arabinose dehydrogenase